MFMYLGYQNQLFFFADLETYQQSISLIALNDCHGANEDTFQEASFECFEN